MADDSTFIYDGVQWKFDYNDNVAGSNYIDDLTGTNFVTKSVVAIPESSTMALVGSAAVGLLHGVGQRRWVNQ